MFRGLLVLLVCCCLLVSCTRKNSDVVFSSKYIPPYNPGGQRFESDEDLARSYDMYVKRRAVLEQKQKNRVKTGVAANAPSQESIEKKLREYGVVGSAPSERVGSVGSAGVMVNSAGIDLSLINGAKTVRVDDSKWGPLPVGSVTKGSLGATPPGKEGLKNERLGSVNNKTAGEKNAKPNQFRVSEGRSDYYITSDDVELALPVVIYEESKGASSKKGSADLSYPVPKKKPVINHAHATNGTVKKSGVIQQSDLKIE